MFAEALVAYRNALLNKLDVGYRDKILNIIIVIIKSIVKLRHQLTVSVR